MAHYQSTWWKHRYHKLEELIKAEPIPEPDEPAEADVELYNASDDRILHERNEYEGTEDEPTPLTEATHDAISTTEIEYVPLLPEYPQKKNALNLVQYASRRDGGKSDIYCSFLGCQVTKTASYYSGMKHCVHLNDYLRNLSHTEVNEELVGPVAFYDALRQKFLERKACKKADATCEMVYGKFNHQNVVGEELPFVRCSNGSASNHTNHYFTTLYTKRNRLDIGLLISLLQKEQREVTTEVYTAIYQTSSRAQFCDVVHLGGRGAIQRQFPQCTVKFRTFVPKDIEKHPYAIFYSAGIHNHPPPPPSKPPYDLIEELWNLLSRGQTSDLTLSAFLRSDGVRDLAARYGAQTLSELYQSFANKERFSVVLTKRRAIDYPMGRHLVGVYFEMEKNPAIKLYVREIVYNEKGAFIFCALNEQLEILASLHSFEVDMSYKRVKGVFNEVIFATFVPKHGKIMTLFRVFTDQETTKAYHFIFGNVFNLVERCIGKKIKFHYLHGSGIRSIITDMCPKQMTGLGKMLQETDQKTNNRDLGWRWHTMNELADLIIAHNPELKGWAEHKKIDVIAAGLCNACSPIDSMFFEEARKHTNAVEQSHYKSYHMGTQDTLLGTVTKSKILDETDVQQYHSREAFDIRHSYHTDDMQTRFSKSIQREESLRRKRYQVLDDDVAPEDKELYEFNSSGNHSIPRAGSKKAKRGRGASSSQGRSTSRAITPAVSNLRHTTSVNTGNNSQDENSIESLEDQRKKVKKLREDLKQQERQLVLRERENTL
ncbi:hypothetical protein CBS147339_2395 [Penicillium roqueforti]|nr:hypothetical protein DTO012A8_9718 [Penicillium roqueforti]KAI3082515.1 hypothetical protein CBS147339_2395 [Penicillium roqueforti]KAI3094912.1 hypothetical protein CBS147338_6232 [Penicillium roqueforti]KAI3169197.1 hypothetical protein DTO046C5_4261 [Penicillium roqueforti]KAI3187253.1 hypothetical protein DTO032C6_4031 [Penicillium roqueforti]